MLPERGSPRSGIKEAPVGLCVMPPGVTLNWSRLTRMLATITATSCGDPYDLKGRDVLPNVSRIATFLSDFPTFPFPRHQVAARGYNALSGGSTVRSTLLSAPQLDRYLTRGDYHGKYRHPEADHQEGCVVSSGNHSNATPTSRLTGMTVRKLSGAPKSRSESSWNWSGPLVVRSVDDYYRGMPAP